MNLQRKVVSWIVIVSGILIRTNAQKTPSIQYGALFVNSKKKERKEVLLISYRWRLFHQQYLSQLHPFLDIFCDILAASKRLSLSRLHLLISIQAETMAKGNKRKATKCERSCHRSLRCRNWQEKEAKLFAGGLRCLFHRKQASVRIQINAA